MKNCVSREEGKTYYIEIQGDSATVQGAYGLKLYRGLPMSGSEKPSYETEFNEYYSGGSPKTRNNCYTYALAAWRNPKTGYLYEKQMSPGAIATNNDMPNFPNYMSDEQIATYVWNLMQDDFEAMGLSRDSVLLSDETSMPPEGYYKIALRKTGNRGFHFLRQVSDKNGAWAHKPGEEVVSFVDETPKVIYNPRTATFDNYPSFVCYYVIKPCT